MAININAKTSGVGGLETSADNSGEINIQSGGSTVMSVTSSGVAVTGSFSQNGAVYSTQPSFRNLIINGDMRIDQRNAGASVTPTNGSFVTDRFRQLLSVASKYTGQQVSDAPSGFTNSLKLTSSSAYTVGSAEVFGVEQRIEGNNIAHLDWGTANAKDVTLSFWVKSSLTGTLSGAVSNNTDAAYPFDYTISSANTWEKKTINISGPTIGTWLTTNGVGVTIKYMIGIDPTGTWANTPNVWTGANEFGATTQNVNIVGTSGATWQITGVQLEVGSTATDFENLPYDVELARCQRYCWVWDASQASSNFAKVALGWFNNATTFRCLIHFPTTMRASPSSITSTGAFNVFDGTSNRTVSAVGIDQAFTQTLSLTVTTISSTQFRPGFYQAENNQTAKLEVSAEL